MKPLNQRQKDALKKFKNSWTCCPLGIKSATLLSLRSRDLIEGRVANIAGSIFLGQPYTSIFYEWRKK